MSLTDKNGRPPRILVFAGPNGSGKSTVTQHLPIVGSYVNADEIKAMTGCTDLEAAQRAEATRELLLAKRKDFTFETVLSTPRNLELLRRAKEAGYQIEAVFVLTADSSINVERVRSRVADGGHPVPEEKIISRYERSLKNLLQLTQYADRTRVIDNTGESPELIFEVEGKKLRIYEGRYWTKKRILSLLSSE